MSENIACPRCRKPLSPYLLKGGRYRCHHCRTWLVRKPGGVTAAAGEGAADPGDASAASASAADEESGAGLSPAERSGQRSAFTSSSAPWKQGGGGEADGSGVSGSAEPDAVIGRPTRPSVGSLGSLASGAGRPISPVHGSSRRLRAADDAMLPVPPAAKSAQSAETAPVASAASVPAPAAIEPVEPPAAIPEPDDADQPRPSAAPPRPATVRTRARSGVPLWVMLFGLGVGFALTLAAVLFALWLARNS
jgi:hypothetical protein